MIKRIIFDLDNTLIDWKDEYWDELAKIIKELNLEDSNEIIKNIILAIGTYEDNYEYYSRQTMLKHINKMTNQNFDIDFLNRVLLRFEKCVPEDNEKVKDVLEYLSKKYEMVILTNWFKDVQENRLKNAGILNYFSKVFAGENFKIKPNEESYTMAMENRKIEECIMVGDSLKNDIQGALSIGMKAIYINPTAKKEEKKEYMIINNIEELKVIL